MNIVEGGKDLSLLLADCDTMLVVSRPLVVASTHRPSVAVDGDIPRSNVDHRLDADAHPRTEKRSDTAASIVGDIRILMKTVTNAMTCKLTNDSIASLLAVILHSITDMAHAITDLGLFDADIETLFCCTQQAEHLLINLAYREGVTAVAIETVDDCAAVASNDISIPKFIVGGESVYYLVIDFDAECAGKSIVTLETRDSAVISNKLFCNLVKLKSSNTWLDPLGDFAKCLSNQLISLSYQLYFFVSLQKYHSEIINKQLQNLCDL